VAPLTDALIGYAAERGSWSECPDQVEGAKANTGVTCGASLCAAVATTS
jgi:hypothetical protein